MAILREPPESSEERKIGSGTKGPTPRHLPSLLLIALGIALTLSLFFVFRGQEAARVQTEFEGLAIDRAHAIEAGLSEDTSELELVGSYILAANERAAGKLGDFLREFGRFAHKVPEIEADTVFVAFVPRVTSGQAKDFTGIYRSEFDPSFAIHEAGLDSRPAGETRREEYFPVAAVEPPALALGLIGLDLASVPELRAAIEKAFETGRIAASEVIALPKPSSDNRFVWHFIPVFKREISPGQPVSRSELIGFAVDVSEVDKIVENAIANLMPAGIDLEVADLSAPADRQVIYYHKTRYPGAAVPMDKRGWPSWQRIIDGGGRTWRITAYPTPRFLEQRFSPLLWIALGSGLALTAAAVVIVEGRLRRERRIESMVAERTLDLAAELAEHERLGAALDESRSALAKQVEQLLRGSKDMLLLNELGDTLAACIAVDEAYPVISSYLPRLFPGTRGGLYMREASGNLYVAAARWGDPPPAAASFVADDCWALRRGKTHSADSSTLAVQCRHESAPLGGSSLCIPLAASGRTIGIFHASGTGGDAPALVLSAADRIGLALSNLMLREDLRRLSLHDPLTGLFNRRFLEESLEVEISRAERSLAPIGLIMLDLDHFKDYNDEFGHQAGDELLQALGRLVSGLLRTGDIACRYGGEEFVFILPEASGPAAVERAEEIRKAVLALDISFDGKKLPNVSASMGVAAYPAQAKTAGELLAAADACLYKAKNGGRNRVVFAENPEEKPST